MDNNIENLVFAQFDYYIYMYYLIMYHNFKIENIEVSVSAFLTDGEKEFFEPKSNKYKSINIYHSHPNIYKYFPNNENIFLFHQIDHFNKSYRKIFFKWKGVVVKKLRQFIACFVPSTKLRRKIRGQNK